MVLEWIVEVRSDQSRFVAGVGDINEDGIDDSLLGACKNYKLCGLQLYILFGGSTVGGNGLFDLFCSQIERMVLNWMVGGESGYCINGTRRHKWRCDR